MVLLLCSANRNFEKFLVNQEGVPIERFESKVTPEKLEEVIKKHLVPQAKE